MAAGCRPTAVVIGVVIDRHGRPLCSETWPGNATDVQALLPVIDRLRGRFAIGRICIVADRGMISARTLAELEERSAGTSKGALRPSRRRVLRTGSGDRRDNEYPAAGSGTTLRSSEKPCPCAHSAGQQATAEEEMRKASLTQPSVSVDTQSTVPA
jgi:hypothetical protein